MEFYRPEYWSGFPSPGDLPNPGIKPISHNAGGFLKSWATMEAQETHTQPQEEKFAQKFSGSILCNHPLLRALLGWEQKGGDNLLFVTLDWVTELNWDSILKSWDKCSDLVHWEDSEGSGGEGGGRGDRDGEYMYINGWFMSLYDKNHYNIVK